MRKSIAGALIVTGAVWLAFTPASKAQANYSSRQALEQCRSRVLATMAISKAPETQVGGQNEVRFAAARVARGRNQEGRGWRLYG